MYVLNRVPRPEHVTSVYSQLYAAVSELTIEGAKRMLRLSPIAKCTIALDILSAGDKLEQLSHAPQSSAFWDSMSLSSEV